MWAKLKKVLDKTGLAYDRQGSYTDDLEYPNSFFTFWNYDTPNQGFYDNESHRSVWYWQVYYYTNDPDTLYTNMDKFITAAKKAGFKVDGRGTDIKSDRPDYFGRTVRLIWDELC